MIMNKEEAYKLFSEMTPDVLEYVFCLAKAYEGKDKEIERLNNNWDKLEKWLNEYYESNRKWYNFELSNHDKKYYEETYRNTEFMIVKFLKQLKELKEGK